MYIKYLSKKYIHRKKHQNILANCFIGIGVVGSFILIILKFHKHFLNTFLILNIKKAPAIAEALVLVRMKGFEPPRRETHGPQPCASASSATSAYFLFPIYYPA